MASGLAFLVWAGIGHLHLSVHYISKTHGILRMSSKWRHSRIKPYGWEHSSSIFHVGSEVIQSLTNACCYILSVKIFLELWYFTKSSSALTNQSSSPWSKLHLAGQLLLLLCFLFLDSMRYPRLTLSHSPLLLCVSAFLFQVTNRVQTRTVEEDGRPLLNFTGLWPYCFFSCLLYSVNCRCSRLTTRTTADPSALRSPRDRIWREISTKCIMIEVVSWWLLLFLGAMLGLCPLEPIWVPFNRHWSDTHCAWSPVILAGNINVDKIGCLPLSGFHHNKQQLIQNMPCARYCFKCLPCVSSCDLQNDSPGSLLLFSTLFSRWGNGDAERMGNLLSYKASE